MIMVMIMIIEIIIIVMMLMFIMVIMIMIVIMMIRIRITTITTFIMGLNSDSHHHHPYKKKIIKTYLLVTVNFSIQFKSFSTNRKKRKNALSFAIMCLIFSANTHALKGKRKTLNATDVFAALEDMEFEEFIEPLRANLEGQWLIWYYS